MVNQDTTNIENKNEKQYSQSSGCLRLLICGFSPLLVLLVCVMIIGKVASSLYALLRWLSISEIISYIVVGVLCILFFLVSFSCGLAAIEHVFKTDSKLSFGRRVGAIVIDCIVGILLAQIIVSSFTSAPDTGAVADGMTGLFVCFVYIGVARAFSMLSLGQLIFKKRKGA